MVVARVEVRPQITHVVIHESPALFTNGWVPLFGFEHVDANPPDVPHEGFRQRIYDWEGGNGTKPATGYVGRNGKIVPNAEDAVVIPLSTGEGLDLHRILAAIEVDATPVNNVKLVADRTDPQKLVIRLEDATPAPPAAATYRLGLQASAASPPVASDFTVMGEGGLIIPKIMQGANRYIVGAKKVSDGEIEGVYYYEAEHPNTRNRLGSVFVKGTGLVNIGGEDHNWFRSRAALPASFSGRILRIV